MDCICTIDSSLKNSLLIILLEMLESIAAHFMKFCQRKNLKKTLEVFLII